MRNLLKAGIEIFFFSSILFLSCIKAKRETNLILQMEKKGTFKGINQRIKLFSDSYILIEDVKERYLLMKKMKKEDFEEIKNIISNLKIKNIKEEIVPDDIYYFIDIKNKGTYGFCSFSLYNKEEYKNLRIMIEKIEDYLKIGR